jgi:hypothetical protein
MSSPDKVNIRVCVPNGEIGIEDRHERAVFSAGLTEEEVKRGKETCPGAVCELDYRDITAMASDIEEVGYVVCARGLSSCVRVASETAAAIEVSLRDGGSAEPSTGQ